MSPRPASNKSRGGHAPLIITIDGPAGVGKSTAAKLLAQRLGLAYLDTGATYRALAYAARQEGLHPMADADRIARMARRLPIELGVDDHGSLRVRLSGADVSTEIRTEEVTEAAALISQHPPVRQALVKRQRELANRHGVPRRGSGRRRERARIDGVVVEGRDTGSVVFPRAPYKFFLDANPSVRARRRQRELKRLYGTRSPIVQIREQLHFRDGLDRTRRVGPLVTPRGAIVFDTSRLTAPQVVSAMLKHIAHPRLPGSSP